MSVKNKTVFSIVFLLFLQIINTHCQENKNSLLEKQNKLLKDIELATKLIEETTKKKQNSLEELKLVQAKIRKRKRLIRNYRAVVIEIDQEIAINDQKLNSLQIDLTKQKEEYAELIYETYKTYDTYQAFMFILASNNINQMYRRIKYVEQYTKYRKEKIILIQAIERVIAEKIIELEVTKQSKLDQLNRILSEQNSLTKEQDSQVYIVETLKEEEKSLQKEIRDKRELAKEIEKKIDDIIKNEARGGQYASLTPEEKLISDNFEKNRGLLPWPTMQGIISEQFGEHPHPVLRGVKVRNNGIDITAPENTQVRAIFTGVVSKVFSIKGANQTVLIQHGGYFTVYHNLVRVNVSPGQKVNTKDVIGEIYPESSSQTAVLNFQVWKGSVKLNPEEWISN